MPRIKPIIICLVAGGLGISGWLGICSYDHYQTVKSIEMARHLRQQGRWDRALLVLDASLYFDSCNIEALRLAAEILDDHNPAQALQVRQRIAVLNPEDAASQISLAAIALKVNRLPVAIRALDAVPKSEQQRLDFLELEGIVSSAMGQPAKAAASFAGILRLAPNGREAKAARVNLAQLWLNSRVPGSPKDAMHYLSELADDREFGALALRVLSQWHLQQNNLTEALRDVYRLVHAGGATMDDQIRMLDIFTLAECPLTETALCWLEVSVRGNPAKTARLAEWLIDRRGPECALRWLESLPPVERDSMPVPVVLADCRIMLKDWEKAQMALSIQNWGAFESQRNAMLALASADRNSDQARLAWKTAVTGASRQKGALASLARLALSEGRTEEAVVLLWRVPDTDGEYAWARQILFMHYRRQNDLKALLRLQEEALAHYPNDATTKRSIAALLLIVGEDSPRAMRFAREVYQADPASIANAAVYAYSIQSSGDSFKAAALLDSRTVAEKMSNDCLPYYTLILAACGRKTEARDCLKRIDRSLLFPQMTERLAEAERACSLENPGNAGTK